MTNEESNAGGGVSSVDDAKETLDDKDQSADEEGRVDEHIPRGAVG